MAKQVTLGGDRLGAGKRMKVDLKGYERSTHNLGYLWRSTMSAGTLVPFMSKVALPGDSFDIDLDCDIKTHPTVGPLFGSYKVQLDVFQCPIRLYQAQLHNNKLGIGMNMAAVKLPIFELTARVIDPADVPDLNTSQINPSSLLSYLGLRGIGWIASGGDPQNRTFNAVSLLSYWDIYKNYYANKQEEVGAVIDTPQPAIQTTVDTIDLGGEDIPLAPATSTAQPIQTGNTTLLISYLVTPPVANQIMFNTLNHGVLSLEQLSPGVNMATGSPIMAIIDLPQWNGAILLNYRYATGAEIRNIKPEIRLFPLENLDTQRERILAAVATPTAFNINTAGLIPYTMCLTAPNDQPSVLMSQQGLGLKTYQSDLFNNWISTEWIDGAGGITELTAIDTTGGSFTLDTLNLSKKVYDMLNRIAVSGGSYYDWIDAAYDHTPYQMAETPMYMGGLSRELVFQEVISNSQSSGTDTATQPLGTLAGKGIMGGKKKGGRIHIKVGEPSYIIGIISLTPRIDYSQGNEWDLHLKTMDDFHKPALDEIGFQELIQERFAWWTTQWDGTAWVTMSAGKQPAWIEYMTSTNQVYGNFAIPDNEMFMVLNRRYEYDLTSAEVEDLTTYIDPSKFNHIFAETALDAQNFWTQIAVDITARRKMSAKIMPNL